MDKFIARLINRLIIVINKYILQDTQICLIYLCLYILVTATSPANVLGPALTDYISVVNLQPGTGSPGTAGVSRYVISVVNLQPGTAGVFRYIILV